VRNLATPQRVRDSALARSILDGCTNDDDARRTLQSAVDRALDALDPQDRAIVERCDIERQVHTRVARESGISERHLYRKRHRIFGELALGLTRSVPPRLAASKDPAKAVNQLLKASRALEENGAQSAAADIIERLLRECVEPNDRSRLFLRLAELHARSNAFLKAEECVDNALRNARNAATGETLHGEILLTRAFVMEECGKGPSVVSGLAQSAIRLIRGTGTFRYDPVAAGLLVRALSLRLQAATSADDRETVQAAVTEMRETLTLVRHPEPDTQLAALYAESLGHLFCDHDTGAGATCLVRAVTIASDAGLTLSSTMLSINLASLNRLRGDAQSAIAALTPRLIVVRTLGNPGVLLALLLELANSLLECAHYERASEALNEAISLPDSNESLHAAFLRTSARVHVATENFGEALDEARAAESAYAGLGRTRLIGAARRLQAEALWSSGEKRAALHAIRGAIDALSATNHRVALANAYRVFATISGNTRYLENARHLAKLGP